MKCSLGISNFLEEISSLPILLFSSISWHRSLRKAFLSLLATLWNSAFRWEYLSFCPLPFASLVLSAVCKASSDSRFAFSPFFFLGMVSIPASCTMSRAPSLAMEAVNRVGHGVARGHGGRWWAPSSAGSSLTQLHSLETGQDEKRGPGASPRWTDSQVKLCRPARHGTLRLAAP